MISASHLRCEPDDGAVVDGATVDGATVDGATVDGATAGGGTVDGAIEDGRIVDGAGGGGSSPGTALRILLVSKSATWNDAVHAVADQVHGSRVLECSPGQALVELAGLDRFSHVLLDPACSDGLQDAFADLTGPQASSRTALIMLGGVHPPHVVVAGTADQVSVRQAFSRAVSPSTAGPMMAETGFMSAHELLAAIQTSMLQACYQPIMRLADCRVVSFEALARLNHPVLGTILPDSFVPQLEAGGFARELTHAISARVFADVSNPILAPRHLSVALNFPLNVLTEPAALAIMDEQRATASVHPNQVTVELTESQPVEDIPRLVHALEWLRTQGYSVSIDDVDPAMPRARELLDLPFTGMKLDKGVVQRSAMDSGMLDFLQIMVQAAKRRGLSIVAEGITTRALWDLMLAAGVDHGQGFLIARPLPLSAIPVWLDAVLGPSH